MENYYRKTQEAYNTNASEYAGRPGKFPTPPHVLRLIKTLKVDDKVVDLGCGPGRDTKHFIQAGIKYLGIDFSEETLKIARKNNPKVQFQTADLRLLDFPPGSVNAFMAIASLYHLTKSDFKQLMSKLFLQLTKDGQLLMVMKKGASEKLERDRRYETGYKFSAYYSKKELENILKHTGFKIKESIIVPKEIIHKDTGAKYQSHTAIVLWTIKPTPKSS